jgi:hypothetical protein
MATKIRGNLMATSAIDFHEKAYVCIHVFERTRPILLVDRTDGDWCFLCGELHNDNASEYRVVGIGHVLENDPTLSAILDLPTDYEAERPSVSDNWTRRSNGV